MKKITALLTALALMLGLCACAQSAAAIWQEQYDLGVRYLSEGNYREAIIAFNAAIEIDPKRADAYLGLADAYEAQGDVERARQVLEDALAVVPNPDAIRDRLDVFKESAAPEPTPGTTVEPTQGPVPTSGVTAEPTPPQNPNPTPGPTPTQGTISEPPTESAQTPMPTPTPTPTPTPEPQGIIWTLDNGTLTISGTGPMENYEYRNRPWYEDCDSITKIIIKDGVTSIGDYAFYGCSNLTEVTIPNSVTSIGNYAFRACRSLTSVAIPNSVTSIGVNALAECGGLTSVNIPNSVTSIGTEPFFGSGLSSINVENGNQAYSSIDGVLFNADQTCLCAYPTGRSDISYNIPASVTSIEDGAFAYSHLISVTIPDSVTIIGSRVFWDSNLASVIIPSSVTNIGAQVFISCDNLTNINVTSGNPAYSSVDGVLFNADQTLLYTYPAGKESSSYSIPASVTSISDYAFYGCSYLTEVTIPGSVTSIGYIAFNACISLKKVYYDGSESQWKQISIDTDYNGNAPLLNATIHYNS